jgi:hypothetical protein
MNNYIDKIMSNHVFNSDSSDDLSYLYSNENRRIKNNKKHKGGAIDPFDTMSKATKDVPTGGFPPIFIVSAKEKESEQSKSRQLSGPGKAKGKTTTVSIKDILKSKK